MCSKNNPLVSICVPTYNNARFLTRSLNSIMNQTYKNIEIIVSDNASTDNTEGLIRSFTDKRIRYHRLPVNISFIKNWNKSIQLANAEYRALYHSDDIYMPEIVEKEIEFLVKHPHIGAVFTLGRFIDENHKVISQGIRTRSELQKRDIHDFMELLNVLLKKSGSFMFFPTLMARKEVFSKVGYFREFGSNGGHIGGACDMEMVLRISQQYKIGIIGEKLFDRRMSSSSLTVQYTATRVSRSNHFVALDQFLGEPEVQARIDGGALKQYEFNKFWDDVLIAMNLACRGKRNCAKRLLKNSFHRKHLWTGLRGSRNIAKMAIWLVLLTGIALGRDGIARRISASTSRFLRAHVWNR